MQFNKLIPEFSVFDIEQTKNFYLSLGFQLEYERREDKFIFLSLEGSQFMFEQIHQEGWNTGELGYPLGRGINFSIAVANVVALYERVVGLQIPRFRELVTEHYRVDGEEVTEIHFLIQDPNGYLLRFTN